MKKNSILNFSDASMLAIHSLTLLAKNFNSNNSIYLTTKEMAKILGASENHLSKILQILTKHGYIFSIKGPTGGYKLLVNPENISIKKIIEIIDGPISFNFCPFFKNCPVNNCILGEKILDYSFKIIEELDSINIADASKKLNYI